jgi:hypothetical protein
MGSTFNFAQKMTTATFLQFPVPSLKWEWIFRQSAWTIDLKSTQIAPQVVLLNLAFLNIITPPVFRGRMVVHSSESPREIELIGKAELIAYLLHR